MLDPDPPLVMPDPPVAVPDRPLVISVHGVSSHGPWQRILAGPLQTAGFYASLPEYGYYFLTKLIFLGGPTDKDIRWFLERYTNATEEFGDDRPSVVAHSLGTFIVTRALEDCPAIKIKRLILCGSIVNYQFNWTKFINNGQVEEVFNDCGGKDWVVWLAPWAVKAARPSGRYGFADLADGRVKQRFNARGRHSGLFYPLNFKASWIPFLRGEADPLGDPLQACKPWSSWNIQYRIWQVIFWLLVLGLGWSLWWGGTTLAHWLLEPTLPRTPGLLPPANIIPSEPDESLIDGAPQVPGKDVTFRFKNATNKDMRLWMYNYYAKQHPKKVSFTPKDPWIEWELKPGGEWTSKKDFDEGSGWYAFVIEVDGRFQFLENRSIFYAKNPTMLIEYSGDSNKPFVPHFDTLESQK